MSKKGKKKQAAAASAASTASTASTSGGTSSKKSPQHISQQQQQKKEQTSLQPSAGPSQSKVSKGPQQQQQTSQDQPQQQIASSSQQQQKQIQQLQTVQGPQGQQQPLQDKPQQQQLQGVWAIRRQRSTTKQDQQSQLQQQAAQGLQQQQAAQGTQQQQQISQSQQQQVLEGQSQQQVVYSSWQQPQQSSQQQQTAWLQQQQVPQGQLQQVTRGLQQQPQQIPQQQQTWPQQQQIPQGQLQQVAWGLQQQPQQIPQQQQTVWPQQQQVLQSQQQITRGLQQQPQQILQQQQTAWPQQQQIPQGQQLQQVAWGLQQQLRQIPQQQQTTWSQQHQVPQGQRLQVPWNLQQKIFQQTAQGPRQQQQVSQGQPQQQQLQEVRSSRQQIPQSQLQQQVAQDVQQQRQISQSQLQQQQVLQSQSQQVTYSPWQQPQPVPQQQTARHQQQQQKPSTSTQQQQRASTLTQQQQGAQRQQQQKTSIDISAAGDYRQAVGSGIQQPSTSAKSLDVSELGLTDPFYSITTEKAKMSPDQLKLYQDMIPKRTHFEKGGSTGRKINVLTNMFKIIFDDKFVTNAVHYDVTIKPYRDNTIQAENSQQKTKEKELNIKLPKSLCRKIFEQCRKKYFRNRNPAYDGKKNAYSANDLIVNDIEDVFENVNENGRRNQFHINIRKVANVDLSWIKNLRPGSASGDQTAIQVLDIIMRHAPESRCLSSIGRSLFWDITEAEPLGNGVTLARGGFMSGILGWKPYLNVDVSHKGFTTKQKVLTYITKIVNIPENELTSYDILENKKYIDKIKSFLKGLKVIYEIPGTGSRRTHRITELTIKNSYDTFLKDGESITIQQYFSDFKKYSIQKLDLPLLQVGKGKKEVLLPIELCTIMPNQPIRKLDEEQTANMIKKAATDAETRKRKIEEAFKKIEVNNSNVMSQEFHLSVNSEMETVPARILPAPELKYGIGKQIPRRGTWNVQPFNEAKNLEKDSWTILNLSRANVPFIEDFKKKLRQAANEVGMTIGDPSTVRTYRDNDSDKIKIKTYLNENKHLKLIIVIISDNTEIYSYIKRTTEIEIGVLTQCIKFRTLQKPDFKLATTLRNILLKINSKLNGVNHIFDKMPACLKSPCMLIGADVTHPSPDSTNTPSIAAVAASRDKSVFRYNVALRLQQPKEEMILDLEQIILSQLEIFKQESRYMPKRIFYYRDGVSEGQLPQVMFYEINAIKKAIKQFTHEGKQGNIEITCLVVQKRHHVRLFPMSRNDTSDRNFNVNVGTIVDTTITHPEHIDFYLVSHASIQGTARPTKYRCIINESNFTEDQLEELTYYLCHIYARCARSVSYPAPTYYAHLAAYRGRTLLHGDTIQLSDLEMEQKKFTIKMGRSPMFFV